MSVSAVRSLREQRLTDAKRIARLEATIKLVKDRAQFAIEFADRAQNDCSIIGGLLGQFASIESDAREALKDDG